MAQTQKSISGQIWIPLVIIAVLAVIAAGFFIVRGLINTFGPEGPNVSSPPLRTDPTIETVTTSPVAEVYADDEPGFNILLSEGQSEPQEVAQLPVTAGEPLSESEIEQILARLPGLVMEPEDQMDFRLPEDLLPPPRTGETIEEEFPLSPEAIPPQEVEVGPLEVLRYAPEGEIPLAPFVNVTFNQPMVPLSTISQLSMEEVPVQVIPDLPGSWTWVGTKTLTFQYDSDLIDRLPMATEYQVTVPAGTESATGGVLAQDVSWTFSTPPVTITDQHPSYDPQPLDPLFFVAFDQRIDPQSVLDTIEVMAGNKAVDIALASEEEIKEDATISRRVENTPEGRSLVFRADKLLPKDTTISITIGPGTPSAEGPLLSQSSQGFSFSTYAPLRIEEHGCSWYGEDCYPLQPFFIRFNNPLDIESYEDKMLRIDPAIPGASVNIIGNTITIRGATEGRTTYRVTVDKNVQDGFGQTLGKDDRLTFKVGPAEPVLVGPDDIFVTLDPAASKPVLSLYAINYQKIEVQIYAVEPSDWPAYKEYLREYERTDEPPDPPGTKVLDQTMRLDVPEDTLTEVGIDLSEVMEGHYGHYIVVAKPPRSLFEDKWQQYYQTQQVWVQVTQIGMDAFADHSEMITWVTALKDGTPLNGITITADAPEVDAVTGEDGVARFDLPASGATYLVARQGDDKALLPRSSYFWGDDTWQKWTDYDELRWYVLDDRQMYRPGEDVHVKGWMRLVGGGQDGDVGFVGSLVSSVSYQILDPQGNDLGSGHADVSALGGFDFSFSIPEQVNLGYAQLILEAQGKYGDEYYHNFQIQEFRRPEFEVSARNETTGPYYAGEHAVVAVSAEYYAGGPLPNAETNWSVTSSPTNYQPPNWTEFSFGTWTPWWWYFDSSGEYNDTDYLNFSGVTDATGTHFLRLDFDRPDEPRPYSILAEASVMDVNRQAWAGTTSLMVHPADLYVGMRSERYFVERGTPLEISFIAVDLDGNPVVDRPIKVNAARLEWKLRSSGWQEEEADVQECTVGSQEEPVTCTFETPIGGRYQITAVVSDEMGRQNQSRITRWVSGGQQPPSREVEHEEVNLIPDKETYQPGDVAQILVQSPFTPAEGLLTVSRSGILYTERFLIEDGTSTLKVPIEEKHIPNLHVQVDLVGSAVRTDDEGETISDVPPRPAYATGQLNLSVPPLERTLLLEVNPLATELEPGGETKLAVTLKDADGSPMADAELAVIVVDEAVLALSSYKLADPVAVFYQTRSSDLSSRYGRSSIILADPQSLAEATGEIASTQVAEKAVFEGEEDMMLMEAPMAAPMEEEMGMDSAEPGAEEGAPIRVRSDFNPLATFAPEVRTDANGEAVVDIALPDNLTRYRVMVVAVDDEGSKFGSAEANLTARLPLMVRPSAPRFLNFGDRFELPIVLQNQTDEEMSVDVAVQVGNILLTEDQGMRVLVPARDRIEVRFPATTDSPGTARFQIAAVSGNFADAAEVELPVYTPATTEAFATYGVVDEGTIVQPVASPEDVFTQFGGLEITTSSTALQALTDAVLYLVSYPYDCSEQLASRILAVSALRDVLTAFEADGLPAPEEMEAAVLQDLAELEKLQNYDGGFPYWRRGFDSIPFNTVHAALAMQRAQMMNFEVSESMQDDVLIYLRNIEDHYPWWYSQRTKDTISSYALYVRHLMGDGDADKARRLFRDRGVEELSLEAVAWLWQVLNDTPGSDEDLEIIRRHVNNRAVETAGAANFTTSYGDDAYLLLHSNRRTDALLLDALIADNPNSDLIPKVVTGLLANRTSGRWGSTQENVFILLALDRYFNTYESQTPDFVARIWLGETYAGSHEFSGYNTERHETNVPMVYLTNEELGGGEMQDLTISKDGPGRLYYRLGLRYAPTDLELDPMDMGFVVQRVYEAVDDPGDVYLDSDGVWHIRAGARVRVRLTMVADNRRYHVALVDPLPAGLEIVNPALAVSGSVPQDPDNSDYRYGWWWWGPWYEHQNMRDERVEAFASLLWEGVYNYTYVARATTPGTFVVPPTKAEEMYSPEVFGRSGSDFVIVE
jgi:alpha-2-macroglobulin